MNYTMMWYSFWVIIDAASIQIMIMKLIPRVFHFHKIVEVEKGWKRIRKGGVVQPDYWSNFLYVCISRQE